MKQTPKTDFPVGRRVDPFKDIFSEWRSSPVFIAEWSKFLSSPLGKAFLDVLHYKIPQNFPMRGNPITGEQACVELGRIEGYRDALRIIELLAVERVVKEPLKATYQPPE